VIYLVAGSGKGQMIEGVEGSHIPGGWCWQGVDD